MNLPYQSQALQDRFVAKILNYKRDGYFLDIGACHASSTNNTFALEQGLGWRGICIEMDSEHNDSYKVRSCRYINDDATTIDYARLLEESGAPKVIDYLSLDVDAISTEVLKMLPLEEYKFTIITLEHDHYIHGGKYRDEQREILKAAGYVLLCSDVLVPLQDDTRPDCSFEDWWCHSSVVTEITENIACNGKYPKDIIEKL